MSGRPQRAVPKVTYAGADDSNSDNDDKDNYVSNEEEASSDEETSIDDCDEDASSDDDCYEDASSDDDCYEDANSAEQIRDLLMKDQGYCYTTFKTLKEGREVVLRALRFVRNFNKASAWGELNAGPVAKGLIDKLLANYHLDKLKGDRGGIPRAFKCERTVCTLFALLLERVIPEKLKSVREKLISSKLPSGLGDPLAEYSETFKNADIEATDDQMCEIIWKEISNDLEELPAERYIKRCVGGAIAYIVKYPDKIDKKYFNVYRGSEEKSDDKRAFRVLGANTKERPDETKHNRLIIPIYSKVADEKPTYICAHLPIGLEMKDLLETCKIQYPDVMQELGDRTFTLVFSPYEYKFGHSGPLWDQHYTPKLRFVTVPPEYQLPPYTRKTDLCRGMICAIEGDQQKLLEDNKIKICLRYSRTNVQEFSVVIRDTEKSIPCTSIDTLYNWACADPNLKRYMRLHLGLKITCRIPGFLGKNLDKTYVVFRPTTARYSEQQRYRALKDKLEKCATWFANRAEKCKTRKSSLPWPGSIKAQGCLHALIETSIALYPYSDRSIITTRALGSHQVSAFLEYPDSDSDSDADAEIERHEQKLVHLRQEEERLRQLRAARRLHPYRA
tara:strand:- start:5023 stop:6876 length:1854 start_codon:yes stop_codon:yes gene_type:complete